MVRLKALCFGIVLAVSTISCAAGAGGSTTAPAVSPVPITIQYIASTHGPGELEYFDGTSNKKVTFENSITKKVTLVGDDASMTVRGLNSSCSMTNHDGTVDYGGAFTSGTIPEENTALCTYDYEELLNQDR